MLVLTNYTTVIQTALVLYVVLINLLCVQW